MAKITLTSVKALSLININGAQYLGVKEKTETGFNISEAVELTDENFEQAVIKWLKAKNLNQLSTIEHDGFVGIVSKVFTEEQEMQIDVLVAKANYKFKYAVAHIQNDALDS